MNCINFDSVTKTNRQTPPTTESSRSDKSMESPRGQKVMSDVASPDVSIPSVADTSYASSPDDESKSVPTRRTLFKLDEEEQEYNKVMTLAESTKIHASPSTTSPMKYETVLVSEDDCGISETASIAASITSSQTTVIPSWNLSMKNSEDTDLEVPLIQYMSSSSAKLLSPPSSLGAKRRYHTLNAHHLPPGLSKEPGLVFEEAVPYFAHKESNDEREDVLTQCKVDGENDLNQANNAKHQPHVMVEEPPEEFTTSCNSALNLTPKQLAEIFLAFGQSTMQKTPSPDKGEKNSDGTNEAPPSIRASSPLSEASSGSQHSPVSNIPQVESLERECNALKKIIEQDAHTILNLQRALETQKQLCALKEVEIVDKQTELQISEERIVRLKKEREDCFERETELVETIKILKHEVDKMTLKSGSRYDRIEMQRFEKELSSAKSQVEKQQDRIVDLEIKLKDQEEDNFNLKTQIDWLKSQKKLQPDVEEIRQLGEEACTRDEEGRDSANRGRSILDGELAPQSLIRMIEDISHRLESLEREKMEKENKLIEEMKRNGEEMEEIRGLLQLSSPKHTILKVSECPEEIEAITLKDQNYDIGQQHNGCCCDWSILSGE